MLVVDHLSRTYPNGTQAVRDLSLTVVPGEIVALVGGSGCGKTSTLRMLSGLDRPTTGRVVLDGRTIEAPLDGVGMIFQEPRLLPWLTVAANVGFGIAGRPDWPQIAEAALRRVGLADHAKRWPRELSGGQAQRVAILRCLVAEPRLVLLDEPFSALDAFTRRSLQDQLLELWSSRRPIMIIVTHDVEEALLLADRIVVLRPNPGRIAREIQVDLPRPRDALSGAFTDLKREVLAALEDTFDRVA